jgi:hypothetical protein
MTGGCHSDGTFAPRKVNTYFRSVGPGTVLVGDAIPAVPVCRQFTPREHHCIRALALL